MKTRLSYPSLDGFYMPGEFEEHQGCLMIWPERPGSWIYEAKEARAIFAQLAKEISKGERVYLLVSKDSKASAERYFKDDPHVTLLSMESDDAWARDVGPTFVVNEHRQVRGIDWCFNAWGGTVDGLYASWDLDDRIALEFCEAGGFDCYDARPFVLEGGSIHSDGEGTLLVTEACLLSAGRNPQLTKKQIEQQLKKYLGAKKVIWLKHGIYQDETNEHVDNVCAFVKPGVVLLAWTDDKDDPQYEMSRSCLETLQQERDAKGRSLQIVKLPIPDPPVCINQYELDGYVFEEGEDTRTLGERLAASYVNFYIANDRILLPQFGVRTDAQAVDILQDCFPERQIVPIAARAIIVGGGNIHCITQQIPGKRPW